MPDQSNPMMGQGAASSSKRSLLAQMVSRTAERLATVIPGYVRTVTRHWLLLANLVLGLQAFLPFLAPNLMHLGQNGAGQLLYRLYAPLCHQLPERSFFLFGPRWTYSLLQLQKHLGNDVPLRYIGDQVIGFKTTVCQRDVATYLATWAAGLIFAIVRRHLQPLPFKFFILLCLPITIDGFAQLLGVWDSTPLSRTISGALFGLACVWLAFPAIESGVSNLRQTTDEENRSF